MGRQSRCLEEAASQLVVPSGMLRPERGEAHDRRMSNPMARHSINTAWHCLLQDMPTSCHNPSRMAFVETLPMRPSRTSQAHRKPPSACSSPASRISVPAAKPAAASRAGSRHPYRGRSYWSCPVGLRACPWTAGGPPPGGHPRPLGRRGAEDVVGPACLSQAVA